MRIGTALGLAVGGITASAVAVGVMATKDDGGDGPFNITEPPDGFTGGGTVLDPVEVDPDGLHPIPVDGRTSEYYAGGAPLQPTTVEALTDRYLELYDHSGDGAIDIAAGQPRGADERVTGENYSYQTMLPMFEAADRDGDQVVTRAELTAEVGSFDEAVARPGLPPTAQPMPDGKLGVRELKFLMLVHVKNESDYDPVYNLEGIDQRVMADWGMVDNSGFYSELREYGPSLEDLRDGHHH